MNKRIIILPFLILTLLLSIILTSQPVRKAPEIWTNHKLSSRQISLSDRSEHWEKKGEGSLESRVREGHLMKRESRKLKAESSNVDLVGKWPYGPCSASAMDATRNMAMIGNNAGTKLPTSQELKVRTDFGRMPLYFIPNEGQVDNQVDFYVKGKDKSIYFTSQGVTFVLARPESSNTEADDYYSIKKFPSNMNQTSQRWVVKLDFVGASADVHPVGEEKTGAVISYFKGKPEDWHTGLPAYSRIVYYNLWPGIDLVYYGTVNQLKYEFIVHPGADPSRIRLSYQGATSVRVDEEGRLEVETPMGGFRDDVPMAYQEKRGERVKISLAYKLQILEEESKQDDAEKEELDSEIFIYGFEVGNYDRSLPLVLDPVILVYCGYIGGSNEDQGYGIAVDDSGNVYVTGETLSEEDTFPVIVGPDLINNNSWDAFVAKVDVSGSTLVYCGYIGGSSSDAGVHIAVDSSGNAYVVGCTQSQEYLSFPVTVGPDLTYNGGVVDAFVAKVNASGTALDYCGYIGGLWEDWGYGISVDSSGNAYVAGYT